MGTRHLIAVQVDGEYRIAQYGQWDGYPEGQGAEILGFLAEWDRPRFERNLRAAQFLTKEEGAAIGEEADWKERYPHLSRDCGANVLHIVQQADDGIKLANNLPFVCDSLFCEWAYVIDLDSNRLELFKGFNQEPLAEGERFKGLFSADAHEGYFPVRLVGSWPLGELPTAGDMVHAAED